MYMYVSTSVLRCLCCKTLMVTLWCELYAAAFYLYIWSARARVVCSKPRRANTCVPWAHWNTSRNTIQTHTYSTENTRPPCATWSSEPWTDTAPHQAPSTACGARFLPCKTSLIAMECVHARAPYCSIGASLLRAPCARSVLRLVQCVLCTAPMHCTQQCAPIINEHYIQRRVERTA